MSEYVPLGFMRMSAALKKMKKRKDTSQVSPLKSRLKGFVEALRENKGLVAGIRGVSEEKDSTSFYDLAYKLMQHGAEAPWDDHSFKGEVQEIPTRISGAKDGLHLSDTQLHTLNRLLYILKELELGALLALDMGLGKTLIVIGNVFPERLRIF
jgi:SNF2 family DNA or RNA helicase